MAFKDYRDLIRQMEREMQQLSDEAFRGFFTLPVGGAGRFWQPAVDIYETEGEIVVKMELAGARADDIQVSLSSDDRILTISGVRSEGNLGKDGRVRCHQLEIYFGPFERSISLPSTININRDAITASYKEGFLVVTLPIKPKEYNNDTRVIPITSDLATDNRISNESEGE